MTFIGQKVNHKKWGTGEIIEQDEKMLVVLFDSSEKKPFQYPHCFGTFLTIIDPEINEIAVAKANRSAKEAEAHMLAKAQKKQRDDENLSAIKKASQPKKRRVFHAEVSVKRFNNVADFIDCYNSALNDEINYIRSNGGKRIRLTDGKYIEQSHSVYLYSFEADSECFYPDGIEIRIYHAGKQFLGSVVTCNDFNLTIGSPKFLGDKVISVEISADPWQLLKALHDKLETLKDDYSPIIKSLVCDSYYSIIHGDYLVGQEKALSLSLSQPISFIWGPPGTGKTETLAKIVLEFISKEQKVLMLSYSNVSVDGATLRVDELNDYPREGEILRYGYARDSKLLGERCLSSYEYTIRKHPVLFEQQRLLLSKLDKLRNDTKEYVDVKKQLKNIRDSIKAEEAEIVASASFVATTVAKAVVDSVIYDSLFDVVIFDEASMAYIPQIIYSASLAKSHFICMGDFSQLPPIVQSGDSILNCDIFDYCGITEAVNTGKNHLWLCMLNKQYRMHKAISDFASENMYRSRLITAAEIIEDRNSIARKKPLAGKPISIIDLSDTVSICTKTTDNSRINPLSALVAFGFALNAAQTQEVGIISPYAAQARLYRAMARDASEALPTHRPITCATVHQFQGSQKDVIVFDAVDCFLNTHPGTLLSSRQYNKANRLFNVAMTRSRGKFIGVTNVDYMLSRLSSTIMLKSLIAYCKSHGLTVGGALFNVEVENNFTHFYRLMNDGDDMNEYFHDVENAKQTIIIDVPAAMKNDSNFLLLLVNSLNAAKTNHVKTTVRCKSETYDDLPAGIKPFAQKVNYLYNPVTIIDKKIVWYGLPFSMNSFVLKGGMKIRTLYRPVVRINGKKTANALYNFFEMNR